MNTRNILHTIGLLLMLSITSACSDDESYTLNADKAGTIAVSTEVEPMGVLFDGKPVAGSRAIASDNENVINNLHIVVFNANVGDADYGKMIYQIYSPLYVANPYSTLLNLGETAKNKTVRIYAIANIGSGDLFDISPGKNLNEDDFKSIAVYPSDHDDVSRIGAGEYSLYTKTGTPLCNVSTTAPIMVSDAVEVTVANNGLTNVTLRLSRQCTKITLNIIPQKMRIRRYKVWNVPKIASLFSKDENVNDVGYGSLPAEIIDDNDEAAQRQNVIKKSYYVFENYAGRNLAARKATDRHDANIPTGSSPTYVDIWGIPDGYSDTYNYRVYLGGVGADNVIAYDRFSLIRNYEYYVTVKIAGDGTGDLRVSKVE